MKPMKKMTTSRRHMCAGGCRNLTHDLYTRRDNKFREPLYLCEECAKAIGAMAGLVEPKETEPEVQPVTEAEVEEAPEVEEEPKEPEKPKKTGGRGGKPKQKAAE